MTDSGIAQARAKAQGAVTLVVARRAGRNLKGYRIPIHTDVEGELRTICLETLDTLAGRGAAPFSDDLAYDPSSQYLEVPAGRLVAHKPGSKRRGVGASVRSAPTAVEVDPAALATLGQASSLPELKARELANQSFLFYAAVVGDAPDDRLAFVDRWNPYKAGLSGNVMTWFGDRLRRLEGPLLVFERTFDMLVTAGAILVLDVKAFEAVFRDIDAMADRIPVWSGAAVTSLPLDGHSDEVLRRVGSKSKRVATQLRGLFERGAFGGKISIGDLQREMKARHFEVDRLIVQGQLHLDDEDVPTVLKLIDEKLYQGWRTGTEWDVATRARRQ